MSGDGFNFKQLKKEILRRSVSDSWDAARLEWKLIDVYTVDDPETCLCGHHPIIEVCTLLNNKNKKQAEVGNVCVKRFMGFRSDKIFAAIKRIRKDVERAPNPETIELFFEQRLITRWERDFSLDTWRMRSLRGKQMRARVQINEKIISKMNQLRTGVTK